MKVAIVHDALMETGGAERVVEILHEVFPDAPIYTSVFHPTSTFHTFRSMNIRPSPLQRIVRNRTIYRACFPLWPIVFEQFDLSPYELIISSCALWAKGVITKPETCHICFCYTPPRLAWRYHESVAYEDFNPLIRLLLAIWTKSYRQWDLAASSRVDYFIADSFNAARRIFKYYRRISTVIHPPVNASRYLISDEPGNHFLIVSRLNPYKRIDIAVQAFNQLGLRLKIVGTGPDEPRLRKIAKPNIEFMGRVSDQLLSELYARCQALILPGEEDYGITPLEAQASGRPVIAYGAGGALETVVEGTTGIFFHEQTPEALIEALKSFDAKQFDPIVIRRHALNFDKDAFKQEVSRFVQEKYKEHIMHMQMKNSSPVYGFPVP